jgi:hypothetical protein
MAKDCEFEALLGVAPNAYKRKTGRNFDYETSCSFESFSNIEGWDLKDCALVLCFAAGGSDSLHDVDLFRGGAGEGRAVVRTVGSQNPQAAIAQERLQLLRKIHSQFERPFDLGRSI